jgi:hypothetical protein
MDKIALGFWVDLSDLIEQTRRHGRSMSRILRIRIVQRSPEDELQDIQVIL